MSTTITFSWWVVSEAQSERFPKHLWCSMFYWIFPYWNHMIFFHLRNKHNNRSATCYKAFKQHKLVILRSSSHIHCYGQVSITHGNLCISQGTQIMGRVMVGPTVKHMESCIWRSCGIIFYTENKKTMQEYQKNKLTIDSQFSTVSVRHD